MWISIGNRELGERGSRGIRLSLHLSAFTEDDIFGYLPESPTGSVFRIMFYVPFQKELLRNKHLRRA